MYVKLGSLNNKYVPNDDIIVDMYLFSTILIKPIKCYFNFFIYLLLNFEINNLYILWNKLNLIQHNAIKNAVS